MKLSPFTWIFFGICICIICLTFGWVTYKPNMDETKLRDANKDAADSEYAKESRAKTRVKNAQKAVEALAVDWQRIAMVKTPGTDLHHGGIDISENGAQLIVDSRQFKDSIQTAVNAQAVVGGVKLVGMGPAVADPGQSAATILADFYNYPAIPFPVVIFDLGTITVSGSYQQICNNVRAWSKMPNYLAVADGLRLEGTSPRLTGTYAVSLVGYIRGGKLFTALPEIPGSNATGGAGALMGGGGGGGMSAGKRSMGFGGPGGAGARGGGGQPPMGPPGGLQGVPGGGK